MTDDTTPMTALQAVESVAASSAAPPAATDTTQTSASADAIAPPASDTTLSAVTDNTSTETRPPAPPEDRWPSILDNARTKAAAEAKEQALSEWRQQYGWAEQIKPEQIHEMATFYDRVSRDPVGHAVELLNDLIANPQYSAQVRSHAARVLGTRIAAQPQMDADIEPDIPVLDEHGREVSRAYSAETVKQVIAREVQKAVNPLSEDLKTRREREAEAQRQQQQLEYVSNESKRIGNVLAGLPKYDAHKDAIKVRIGELAKADPHSTPGEIAHRAYIDVVFHTLTTAAKSEVLDNLKQKAAAQTERPSGAAATPLKRPTNARELEQTIRAMAGA